MPSDRSQTPRKRADYDEKTLRKWDYADDPAPDAGGGGGAPTNAEYVTLAVDATLTQERVLAVSEALALIDGGAGGNVTLKTKSLVYITAVTGAGTISDKTYEADTVPSDKILTAFKSDHNNITLTAEIYALTDSWQPGSVTVSGAGATPVVVNKEDWTQVDNGRAWTATANLTDADTTGTITATMSDGDTATVEYTRALDPPLVTSAVFDTHPDTTGGDAKCPYLQTQVKSGDTVRITGTTESHAGVVYVKNAGVSSSLQGPYTVTAGAFDFTCTVGSRSSAVQTATLYAKVDAGSTAGADYGTDNTIDQDQTLPNLLQGDPPVLYPASQEAIKSGEVCTVICTHTNAAGGDTYVYDTNGTGELTIPNPTTYSAAKGSVAYLSGDYRESGTNYRLAATRTTLNGASATESMTVKIANTTPVVTVAKNGGGTALDRLGTDDGTLNYKNHTIYLNSSQANLSTYTASVKLTRDAGDTSAYTSGGASDGVGGWSTDGNLRYTNTFRVEDGDINAGGQAANNFTWGACSIKNRAGKEATTITTNPNYSIGGFETRTINMGPITGGDPPYTHTGDIETPVVDTSKTTVVNISKGGTPTQAYEANVTEHNDADSSLNNYWTTVAGLASEVFDDYTQYFHCSDKKFYESVTAPGGFNVTIAESA